MENRCKHGLDQLSCYTCQHENDIEIPQSLILQGKLKNVFNKVVKNFVSYSRSEDWSEEEFTILYDNFKDVVNVRCLEFRKKVNRVVSLLGRSRRSILWQYKHMFRTCEWDRSKNLFNVMQKITV